MEDDEVTRQVLQSTAERKAEEALAKRQRAYIDTFNQESQFALDVLADLAHFCRANESTYVKDESERSMMMREGRREVWLRIQRHINLDTKTLWNIYTNRKF